MSERGICEWAAFSATLAQRLARMLAAGLISPNHQLWSLAVDKILIKTVDADIQVTHVALEGDCSVLTPIDTVRLLHCLAATRACGNMQGHVEAVMFIA